MDELTRALLHRSFDFEKSLSACVLGTLLKEGIARAPRGAHARGT